MNFKKSDYDNAINLPHYELKNHEKMSLQNRAAQFMPFQALNGFSESIDDAKEVYDDERLLDDSEKEIINHKLQYALSNKDSYVTITYFNRIKEDKGRYLDVTGHIVKLVNYNKQLVLDDDSIIDIDSILNITIEL